MSIAAEYIVNKQIRSEENLADLLTKPLGKAASERLTSKYLFRNALTTKADSKVGAHGETLKPP